MSSPQKANRLAQETSPYLQQHAHNPVDWHPWGDEALEKARRENKPILLSIGYASCHWCHVMAHESFEDEETAKVMNELFVNIKVDREERPDLDKIYQTAHYVLTQQSGGWPLTVFMMPDDHAPFFSGTYFPREPRYQLPAFKDVLRSLSNIYHKQPDEIKHQNDELLKILCYQNSSEAEVSLDDQPLQLGMQVLQRSYDQVHGGFGPAPKFPHPTMIEFALENNSPMAFATLHNMAEGGVYDQLEGGFYRYSVDAKWQIPHFEKMLYDNGQLLFLYSLAVKQQPDFLEVVQQTAEWIKNKMQSDEGGYYSSLDADSEGHEGQLYVWNKSEIESILSKDEYQLINLVYGLVLPPNFEKKWHLTVSHSLAMTAERLKITLIKAKKLLLSAKEKLLTVRNKRIFPARDEKVLTSWNALMIKGMLAAGYVSQEKHFLESAERALSFIRKKLWSNHRLLVSYKDKKAHLSAYLDDYVFLCDALIMSLKISWNKDNLLFSIELAEIILKQFVHNDGGFYFTIDEHEKLLYRPINFSDEPTPSGNAVAAKILMMLGHLTGETRYLDAAEKTLRAAWSMLNNMPAEQIKIWRDQVDVLHNTVFAIPDEDSGLPGVLASNALAGKVYAIICEGVTCSSPIMDLEEFKKSIKER
jgi:uncharacterized protein YyaL (SSP411 family)